MRAGFRVGAHPALTLSPTRMCSGCADNAASVQLDEKVAKMVDMGFVSKMAYEALRRTDGDIDRAVELLTQQYAGGGGENGREIGKRVWGKRRATQSHAL